MARVLIVDDVEIVRKALQIGVQKMGHQADGASDPYQALELARRNPPDLALVDYRMPGMDGVTFFESMRRDLGARCPKVLFVSATPADEVRRKLGPRGLEPCGFVKKPFHLDDLWRVLEQALAA
ncbi:MAG TPA: response regulator [Anaeromyxobacteraceae bacterium]|nr:response regulator [Anaeromyxobacteraceae bacterium]